MNQPPFTTKTSSAYQPAAMTAAMTSDTFQQPGQENMAWDIQRNTYIWEDPASGVIYSWDTAKEQWVLDETTLDDQFADTLADSSPYNPEGETYDPVEGSEGLEEKKSEEKNSKSDQTNTPKPSSSDTATPTSPEDPAAQEAAKDEKKKKRKRKAKKKKPNCTLYVTGLPKDVTEEEFIEFFKTAGIIAKDPITLSPLIKIYTDDDGVPKGDGRITFLKVLSIPNAFQLLDGFDFRPPEGHIIKLEIAQFENKENKPRPVPASKKLRRYNQESELGWEEQEKRHVIIKYMFDPVEASKDPQFYENLRTEIDTEFQKLGTVEALKIFERNPEGVIAVKYSYEFDALKCIEKMNGRWFDGRQLVAEFYDGFSNYIVEENKEEEDSRHKAWQKWIVGNDEYVPEESTQ